MSPQCQRCGGGTSPDGYCFRSDCVGKPGSGPHDPTTDEIVSLRTQLTAAKREFGRMWK